MNSLKKTVNFSTPEGKSLIDSALALEARCTGWTISGLLENYLMDGLLPAHPLYREWARRLILGDWGIGDTVSAWALHHASNPVTADAFALVLDFCKLYAGVYTIFSDPDAVDNFRVQASRLLETMKSGTDKCDDPAWLSLEIKKVARVVSELDCESQLDTKYFFELLFAYSKLFKNSGCAYRLIACISRSCGWDDRPFTRYKLWMLLRSSGSGTPIHP